MDFPFKLSRRIGLCALTLLLCWNVFAAQEIHHYIFFGMDREQIADERFLNTKSVEGAQLKYTWKELEPAKNEYDFAAIRHDLEFLNSKGKKLFIQLSDVSFESARKPFPKYLLNDPEFDGGAVQQY